MIKKKHIYNLTQTVYENVSDCATRFSKSVFCFSLTPKSLLLFWLGLKGLYADTRKIILLSNNKKTNDKSNKNK